MLGLRPKLKLRPSLLDLISKYNAQGYQFPEKPHPLSPDDEVAFRYPLPPSPSPSKQDAPETPPITQTESTATMAPSKKQQREDDDEQKGQVFSVSGPVIVAANMLGCAMYELVRQSELSPLASDY
jgi:V-type H+-transporting ATPase subunit A